MPFFDFHIHTRASSCCKENYGYLEVAEKINSLGFNGFGISDHSNYSRHNAEFVFNQKQIQKSQQREQSGLVGLEISIINRKGDLGVMPKILDQLDYLLIAEHIHVAKPLSGFFTYSDHFLHLMKNYPQSASKINRELDHLLEMELNGIRRHPRAILAHILRFPINKGLFFNKLFEMTDRILEALQAHEVAMEIHHDFLNGFQISEEAALKGRKGGDPDLTIRDFFHNLAKRMKAYSIKFSLGSDAHRLVNIVPVADWRRFLDLIGVGENQLITPEFFLQKTQRELPF